MRRKLRTMKRFLREHWPVIAAVAVVILVVSTQLRSRSISTPAELVFQRATTTPRATPSIPLPTPTPTPPPATQSIVRTPQPSTSIVVSAQQSILVQLNTARVGTGADALIFNTTLQRIAQEYAAELAAGQFLSHTSLQGVTFQDRIARSGYISASAAENIAVTTREGGTDVVEMWMNSSGHRANMLNPVFRAVGIGIATGLWQGVPATYVVAEFGSAR